MPISPSLFSGATAANSGKLENGFYHHGVATPVSNHRGTVATVDKDGRNVVLVWLFDYRGGYAQLMIDAETGKSKQVPTPFPPGGDTPYASILSSKNRYYSHFNGYFCEFDPTVGDFTFFQRTNPQMAMGMTEDDEGRIWAVTYPDSGVISYDPATKELVDYGYVHAENWRQYQRYVQADDAGWIYFAIGSTASQIVIFDPKTRKATPVLQENERTKGSAQLWRDKNGKVYGLAGSNDLWFELHKGSVTRLDVPPKISPKPIITSHQGLFHSHFPDGSELKICDLVERKLVIGKPDGGQHCLSFAYTSEGAHLMGVAQAPGGLICGGTAFPMRFFAYNPQTDQWVNKEAYGQWNTVLRHDEHFYVGGYGGGFLLDWKPAKKWLATEKEKKESNPRFLSECTPVIHRPHALKASDDGKTIVLAGTPGYGYTGGGLLFWDIEKEETTVVEHTELLPEQSTQSLVALPSGLMAGGGTISAGTGGEIKAREAEMYLLDLATRKIVWKEALFPGARGYSDLHFSNGLLFGFVDGKTFFAFDPKSHTVIHRAETEAEFGPLVSHQGTRAFVTGENGAIYILFQNHIAQLDPHLFTIHALAQSPVRITAGGDFLGGRIYFASQSHLYSWEPPHSGMTAAKCKE